MLMMIVIKVMIIIIIVMIIIITAFITRDDPSYSEQFKAWDWGGRVLYM